jgi:hypothetical protein
MQSIMSTYLAQYGKATAMLYATIDGEEQAAIAEHWQCSVDNVRGHCMKLRRKLRTWAAEVSSAAAD